MIQALKHEEYLQKYKRLRLAAGNPAPSNLKKYRDCLLYTSDAADE